MGCNSYTVAEKLANILSDMGKGVLTRALHSYTQLPASSSFGVHLKVCSLPDPDTFGLQASATGPAGIWIAGCKQSFNISLTF